MLLKQSDNRIHMGVAVTMNDDSATVLRELTEADVFAFRELRLEALRDHPEAFSADYVENLERPMEFWTERLRHDDDEAAIFGVDTGSTLGGMAGIRRLEGPKVRHTAMIWGVFVRPAWRGQGIADALLGACIGWATRHVLHSVRLSVVVTNIGAIRCYARNGFTVYGVEPALICVGDTYYDELLMARTISP